MCAFSLSGNNTLRTLLQKKRDILRHPLPILLLWSVRDPGVNARPLKLSYGTSPPSSLYSAGTSPVTMKLCCVITKLCQTLGRCLFPCVIVMWASILSCCEDKVQEWPHYWLALTASVQLKTWHCRLICVQDNAVRGIRGGLISEFVMLFSMHSFSVK